MIDKEHKIQSRRKDTVHYLLLHSYLVFLVAVVLGAIFDIFINVRIFSHNTYQIIGFLMLFVSTIIIYWAQSVSSNYRERIIKNKSRSEFEIGPYRFLRSPTHFGLFIMTLGFSLIINSLFSVIFVFIAYGITKFFYLKKQEMILEKKYGLAYNEYKRKVKNWI